MSITNYLSEAANFALTALPVGGLIAATTDSIPEISGWKDLGVAGFAAVATVALWFYNKDKDKTLFTMLKDQIEKADKAHEDQLVMMKNEIEYLRKELRRSRGFPDESAGD